MAKDRATLLQELQASVRSAGDGGKTTAADLRTFLTSLVDEVVDRPAAEPVGTVKLFAGAVAPADWALCDGRLLAIAPYAALFAVLGVTYGGDGTTTFALPDLRGRVAIGAGTQGAVAHERGEVGGTDHLVLTVDQLPSHTHLMQVNTGSGEFSVPTEGYLSSAPSVDLYAEGHSQATLALDALTSTGAGASIPMLPPFASLHYIICLRPGLPDSGPTSVLEFVFEADFADEVVRTMGARQASEYHTEQVQNVVSVTYQVNGADASLPLLLAPGDKLRVHITRTAADQAAIVSLLN